MTFSIKFKNDEGYFVAHTEFGGIRIGIVDCEIFNYPRNHALYSKINAATPETVKSVFNECFQLYVDDCMKKGLKF